MFSLGEVDDRFEEVLLPYSGLSSLG